METTKVEENVEVTLKNLANQIRVASVNHMLSLQYAEQEWENKLFDIQEVYCEFAKQHSDCKNWVEFIKDSVAH